MEGDIAMSKLLGGLIVGITMLALSGALVAAEQAKVRPDDPAAHAAGAGTTGAGTSAGVGVEAGTSAGAGADANRSGANAGANADADVGRSPEYNADLKKCDAMTGAAKTRCVLAAEKKHSASENRRDTTGRADENAPGNRAHSADLQKCDAMSGTEKTRCVSAAKRKHGQM
jgi:hypothetical protein